MLELHNLGLGQSQRSKLLLDLIAVPYQNDDGPLYGDAGLGYGI